MLGWCAAGRNPLQWRHNEHNGISNHRCLDSLLNSLFRCRSKKTSKLCITGLCEPVTGGFPTQRANNTEMLPFDDVIMLSSVPLTWRICNSKHWLTNLSTMYLHELGYCKNMHETCMRRTIANISKIFLLHDIDFFIQGDIVPLLICPLFFFLFV